MKKTTKRLLVFGAVLALGLGLIGVGATQCAAEEPAPEEPTQAESTTEKASEPDPAKKPTTFSAALAEGDTFYAAGEFDKAEGSYQLAIEIDPTYKSAAAVNNRALTFLQQGRNERALKALSSLCEETQSNTEDRWGVFLNYMIAAHANGQTAREALDAIPWASEELDALVLEAENDPGEYGKIRSAIYYNAIYMDMELPLDTPVQEYFDYEGLDYPEEKLEALRAELGYACFEQMLSGLETQDAEHFSSTDPDYQDLIDYTRAKEKTSS